MNAQFFTISRDVAAGGGLTNYTTLLTPDSGKSARIYGLFVESLGDFTVQFEDDLGTIYGDTLYYNGENKLHLFGGNIFSAPTDTPVGLRSASLCLINGVIFWENV